MTEHEPTRIQRNDLIFPLRCARFGRIRGYSGARHVIESVTLERVWVFIELLTRVNNPAVLGSEQNDGFVILHLPDRNVFHSKQQRRCIQQGWLVRLRK